MPKKLHLSLYRFDPEKDKRPYMADYEVKYPLTGNMMVIDAIRQAQEKDSQKIMCSRGLWF